MLPDRQEEIRRLLGRLNDQHRPERRGRLRHVAYTVGVLLLGAVTGTAWIVRADTAKGGPVLPRTPGMGGPIMLGQPGGGYVVGPARPVIVTRAPNGDVMTVPPGTVNAPEPASLVLLAGAVCLLGMLRR